MNRREFLTNVAIAGCSLSVPALPALAAHYPPKVMVTPKAGRACAQLVDFSRTLSGGGHPHMFLQANAEYVWDWIFKTCDSTNDWVLTYYRCWDTTLKGEPFTIEFGKALHNGKGDRVENRRVEYLVESTHD